MSLKNKQERDYKKYLDGKEELVDWVAWEDVEASIKELKDEPVSVCKLCNIHWDGLINECEQCKNKDLEHYIDYDKVDEVFGK